VTNFDSRQNRHGGGGGIRTHGGVAPTTVFETVPIVHSGTPPRDIRYSSSSAFPTQSLEEQLQEFLHLVGQNSFRYLHLMVEPW
jgi:hypothetical protein